MKEPPVRRAELAAYFLADLIPPDTEREVVRVTTDETVGAPGASGMLE